MHSTYAVRMYMWTCAHRKNACSCLHGHSLMLYSCAPWTLVAACNTENHDSIRAHTHTLTCTHTEARVHIEYKCCEIMKFTNSRWGLSLYSASLTIPTWCCSLIPVERWALCTLYVYTVLYGLLYGGIGIKYFIQDKSVWDQMVAVIAIAKVKWSLSAKPPLMLICIM